MCLLPCAVSVSLSTSCFTLAVLCIQFNSPRLVQLCPLVCSTALITSCVYFLSPVLCHIVSLGSCVSWLRVSPSIPNCRLSWRKYLLNLVTYRITQGRRAAWGNSVQHSVNSDNQSILVTTTTLTYESQVLEKLRKIRLPQTKHLQRVNQKLKLLQVLQFNMLLKCPGCFQFL